MKGVYWHKKKKMWLAQPTIHGESLYIGYYEKKEYAEQVVLNAIQRAGPWMKPRLYVEPVVVGRIRWDSTIRKWIRNRQPCEDQQEAGKEFRQGCKRNKFPDRKNRALPKSKPGPYTTADRDNPDRQVKKYKPVVERYSMTPGVTYMKIAKRWVGFAKIDGKRTYLGTFDSEEMAAEAVNKAKT